MTISDTTPPALLYIYNSSIVLFRDSFYAESHKHNAIQLIVSLKKPFVLCCNDQQLEYMAVAIPPNRVHRILESEGWHITLLIEADSLLGRNLISHLTLDTQPVALSTSTIASYVSCFRTANSDIPNYEIMQKNTTAFLEDISQPLTLPPLDHRIKSVISQIQRHPNHDDTKQLRFAKIPLSKSRLSHLFVQQTGVPITQYILWVRIKHAVNAITNGMNLTDGAAHAGFSDLPHLSRTFKKMFGITLSNVFYNDENIRVIYPTLEKIEI